MGICCSRERKRGDTNFIYTMVNRNNVTVLRRHIQSKWRQPYWHRHFNYKPAHLLVPQLGWNYTILHDVSATKDQIEGLVTWKECEEYPSRLRTSQSYPLSLNPFLCSPHSPPTHTHPSPHPRPLFTFLYLASNRGQIRDTCVLGLLQVVHTIQVSNHSQYRAIGNKSTLSICHLVYLLKILVQAL